jgi:glycosyltransferase involved in cell wall biosynthesis
VPDDPLILCVAQLIKGKGVDLLLHALAKVSADYRAVIVGAGNLDDALKGLARSLGLADKVHFEGWASNETLGKFYSRAKIVAVPSRWAEPFGMIGLEAMNHGRPVVAFNVGGTSDWLAHERTGLLVPEQDVAAFARALERLLTDTDTAQRMGEEGLARAHKEYAFEDYLERLTQYLTG